MAGKQRATAIVLEGPRSLVLREFDVPVVGVDDAVLRVEACGLCGADHGYFTGEHRLPVAVVPGHETGGGSERIGPVAAGVWGGEGVAGRRVGVAWGGACRKCPQCLRGELSACSFFETGNPGGPRAGYGMLSVEIGPGLWGGYATHHYLAPESVVYPVPDGLDAV